VPLCGECSSAASDDVQPIWISPGIEEHDHEDIILEMVEAFEQPFHGIQFAIADGREEGERVNL